MSQPSDWPVPKGGARILVPREVLAELAQHVLTRDCYPTAMGYYPQAHKHRMRRQEHDDYLLMYCVDGAGEVSGELDSGASFASHIQAGDIVLLPPGVAHQYAARPQQPWSLFWCHFRGRLATEFYQHIQFAEEPIIRGLNDPNLHSGFSSLLSIVGSGYSLTVFVHAANQLRQVLTLIERLRRRSQRSSEADALALARSYMRDNLHRRLSLEELARVSQLSKFHFNRRYRQLTGYSPLQHFIHLKVEHACYLLESSTLSIADIAFELGYEDPLYFSRVFRKVTGIAPRTYRAGRV
ncbi:MAG: AraC family transcriptional regulator [Oleiphilaceae bacterium]|nr:AraC family transcriptional regulator [Oleiphilaceae bacterium]